MECMICILWHRLFLLIHFLHLVVCKKLLYIKFVPKNGQRYKINRVDTDNLVQYLTSRINKMDNFEPIRNEWVDGIIIHSILGQFR